MGHENLLWGVLSGEKAKFLRLRLAGIVSKSTDWVLSLNSRPVTYQLCDFEQVTQPLQASVATSVKCGLLCVIVETEMTHCMESTWQVTGTYRDSMGTTYYLQAWGLFSEGGRYSH